MAAQAQAYNTVLALGSDGIVCEVVKGFMALPQETRPALGVIPIGSGNDNARPLGMPPSLALQFDQVPPAQMDGEPVLPENTFTVSIVP